MLGALARNLVQTLIQKACHLVVIATRDDDANDGRKHDTISVRKVREHVRGEYPLCHHVAHELVRHQHAEYFV